MPSPAVLLFCLLTSTLAQQVYNLTLPWGIWQSEYDSQYKVYKFLNVRFGAPPTGSRRFQAAAYPEAKRFAPLDSILVSHDQDEAYSFINPPFAHDDAEYKHVLGEVFPGDKLASVRQAIADRYSDSDQTLRLENPIQDAVFLSNNRALIDAYSGTSTSVWAMKSDALKFPCLWKLPDWDLYGFLKAHLGHKFPIKSIVFNGWLKLFSGRIVSPYGTYFTNQAARGNPNLGGNLGRWDPAMPDTTGVKQTMQVNNGLLKPFTSVLDEKLTAEMGKFWLAQGTAIMETMGDNRTRTQVAFQDDEL